MAFSRGKMMVSLVDNKMKSYLIEDSKKSSSTVNSNEDLPELVNPQNNIIFPSEENIEENLNSFNVDGHLFSSTRSLLATNKDDEHLSIVEAATPEESLLKEESHTQVSQWELLEPTAAGTNLMFKRFNEKQSKPVDWSQISSMTRIPIQILT